MLFLSFLKLFHMVMNHQKLKRFWSQVRSNKLFAKVLSRRNNYSPSYPPSLSEDETRIVNNSVVFYKIPHCQSIIRTSMFIKSIKDCIETS